VNERERELVVRRIVVAVESLPRDMSALEAAAELAARLQAELLGLFVEDSDLLSLADTPFVGEISVFSAQSRRPDAREMERQFRAQARRIRQAFEEAMARAEVRGTFRVTRGRVKTEVLTAAREADVLILGKGGWNVARSRRLGRTIRALLAEAPASTLVLQRGAGLDVPVGVMYDDSPLAGRALMAAALLARRDDERLTVFLVDGEIDEFERLRNQVTRRLAGRGLDVRYRAITQCDASRLARVMQIETVGVLVMPGQDASIQGEALLALLDEVEVPVLLVR